MYRIKVSMLEAFRAFREDENEMPLDELIAMIKGSHNPISIMTIDQLIRAYFDNGAIRNESFNLSPVEFDQLQDFKRVITDKWSKNVPVYQEIKKGDIQLYDNLPLLYGFIGAELRIGMEFINTVPEREILPVSLYDSCLRWKFYCEALNLNEFKLFTINYGDYRPYKFEFATYSYYPYPEMVNEIVSECLIFIEFCQLKNLEKFITI